MKEFINQNWFSIVLALAGITVSYIFYKKSIKKAIPAYQHSEYTILDLKDKIGIDNINLFFGKKEIERLIKTNIVFWNDGNSTIYGDDISNKDKLKIKFKATEGKVLSAKIIKSTREVNEFKINQQTNENDSVYLGFDFLDQNDGVIIEVLHTFSKNNFEIYGTIIGIPEGIKNYGSNSSIRSTYKKNIIEKFLMSNYSLLSFAILGLLFIYLAFNPEIFPNLLTIPNKFFIKIYTIVQGTMLIIVPFVIQNSYDKDRFPQSLNSF